MFSYITQVLTIIFPSEWFYKQKYILRKCNENVECQMAVFLSVAWNVVNYDRAKQSAECGFLISYSNKNVKIYIYILNRLQKLITVSHWSVNFKTGFIVVHGNKTVLQFYHSDPLNSNDDVL